MNLKIGDIVDAELYDSVPENEDPTGHFQPIRNAVVIELTDKTVTVRTQMGTEIKLKLDAHKFERHLPL